MALCFEGGSMKLVGQIQLLVLTVAPVVALFAISAQAEIQSVDEISIDSATFTSGSFWRDPKLVIKSGKDTIEVICRGYDNSVQVFSDLDEEKRIPLEINKDQCAQKLAAAADSSGHTLQIESHKSITIK